MTPAAARSSSVVCAVVVFMALVAAVVAQAADDESDCVVAQTAFSDCTAYVAGMEEKVSPRCCLGLGDIRDLAADAAQRRALCACILAEMIAVGKVNAGRVAGLTAVCGVPVGFIPTGPGFDCAQIS